MKTVKKTKILNLVLASLLLFPLIAVGEEGHDHGDEHGHGHEEGESHIELSNETLTDNQIVIEKASSGAVSTKLHLNGKILPNENKVAHLMPRFSGVIKEAFKGIGDIVKKGDPLAIIESNQNLQAFELKSPFAGVVLKRHATIGELASESNDLFVVADLSEVWVDFYVFGADLSKVKVGQEIHIKLPNTEEHIETKISFVSSVVEETTQSKFARAILPNTEGSLYPGAFVSGELVLEKANVPIAVKATAIQNLEGKSVVFVKEKDALEPKEVKVGRNDGEFAEILSGISVGDSYAAGNSFILKAEAAKGEAKHEH